MKHIENVKKMALQIGFNDIISDYSDLLKKANTCTIETRWKRQFVTEVYKAVNVLTPSYISDMFQEKTVNYNLRRSKLSRKANVYGIHYQIYVKMLKM